ncbi:hypothetical protein IVB02_18875 [Bradyrhizobium sp. 166]|uniref:hypothetical protein n=1 Tax=Bradyrhizobium sp. 166 TaxID=2782638 RepID=UPI001FF75CA3|nr:hypothetical protein [Bradyrhizobium sp. 166]MCK1603448.1 hypothetical protein [Bradyrhizobium sp. 166]
MTAALALKHSARQSHKSNVLNHAHVFGDLARTLQNVAEQIVGISGHQKTAGFSGVSVQLDPVAGALAHRLPGASAPDAGADVPRAPQWS